MITLNLDSLHLQDTITNEAYKRLRTNIQFCGEEKKVITVTSCTPNEGKSSVSFNLACSLAEIGKRVIFIDADLRKSVMLGKYKVNKAIKGFTHYLAGQNKFNEVVHDTNIKNLHVIFSGPVPPNPSELLSSKYFKVIIQELRKNYDYVIIDTPPLGSVIDGAIIANECDGAVMVVSANNVSYKFAQKVQQQLEKTNCPVLGVVLNKVDFESNKYYGKYYGREYGNY